MRRSIVGTLLVLLAACDSSTGTESETPADSGSTPEPDAPGSSDDDAPTPGDDDTDDDSSTDDDAIADDDGPPLSDDDMPSDDDDSATPSPSDDDSRSDDDSSTSDDDSTADDDSGGAPSFGDDDAAVDDDTPSDDDTVVPPSPVSNACDPLPPAEGPTIELSPQDDLAAAVAAAEEGTTLLLADGEYDVSGAEYIVFDVPGVTLRSLSGDPESVVIDGGYEIGSILNVRADDVTIAEVTLQRCQWHPIHVTGGVDSDTNRTTIYRVRVIDPGQQAIKINASEGYYADEGRIECSTLLLTDEGRERVTDCYTGGVDAHLARAWHVSDNHIEGFFCAQGLSEHAVHFWNSARDTVVERNRIVDCARGVGFGLGESGNGTSRDYGDDACPGAGFVGHYGGTIRNNMVFGGSEALFSSEFGMDSGVSLEQACGTIVVHNSVFAAQPPFVSMEYRFSNTDVVIANNLVSHRILERDGGLAELVGNLTDVPAATFNDAAAGDLHLAADSVAIDQSEATPAIPTEGDFDGDPRDDGAPDVGADEL
jgi:hypothetical protein